MELLMSIVQMLSSMPVVGPVIVIILSLLLPASALISALILLWQAAVQVLTALAMFPGLGKIQGAADWLKTEEDSVEGWIGKYAKPIIDRLSLIPIPKKPSV